MSGDLAFKAINPLSGLGHKSPEGSKEACEAGTSGGVLGAFTIPVAHALLSGEIAWQGLRDGCASVSMVYREREQARAAARAKEAEEEARLRAAGAGQSELRVKQRPVRVLPCAPTLLRSAVSLLVQTALIKSAC